MPSKPLDRREFLRLAGLSAGTMGASTLAGALSGCGGSSPTEPRPPASPSDLVATVVSATRIDLAWTDNSSDETSFELDRHSATEPDFVKLADLPAGAISYQDTTVVENRLYYYRLRAVAEGLASAYTTAVEAQTPSAGTPPAPTGLTVTDVTTTTARLAWSGGSGSEDGYRLQQLQGVSFVTIQDLGASATTGEITGLVPDDLHEFRLLAFNEAGESAPSATTRLFTGAVIENAGADPQEPGRLRLHWSDRTGGRLGFRVLRRAEGGEFAPIGTAAAGGSSFDDTAVPPGGRLTYRVEPQNAAAAAGPEPQIDVPAAAPAAPSSLQAALLPTNGAVARVTWGASPSPDRIGYAVEHKVGPAAFAPVRLGVDPGENAYEETPEVPFVPVTYRVRAWNLAGYSPYSPQGAVTPRAVFPIAGTLVALRTVGKGATVSINRPSMTAGSGCNSPRTNLWLIRESEARVTAVVAHCTHQCLTVPTFHWVEALAHFECAHGSQFDANGSLLQGPAPTSVPSLPAELFEDRVEVLPPA